MTNSALIWRFSIYGLSSGNFLTNSPLMMKFLLHLLTGLLCLHATLSYGQSNDGIGIGTQDIADDAILHIESGNKGLLIPQWTSLTTPSVPGDADGLLIYKNDEDLFYVYTSSGWKKLLREDAAALVLSLTSTNNITAGGNVSASGNISGTDISASSDISATGGISAGQNISATGNVTGQNMTATAAINGQNVTASNNVVAEGRFEGNGIVPLGGIIMWAGAVGNVPNNFELCDGGTVNGISVPDLVDKFIMAAATPKSTSGQLAIDHSGDDEYLSNGDCSPYQYLYSGTYLNTCDSSYPEAGFSNVPASGCADAAKIASGCTSAQPISTCTTTANPKYNKTKPSCRVGAGYYQLAFIIRVE